MVDTSQIVGADIIVFSAETTEAELWMRKKYGRHKISFNVPTDHVRLQLFVRAAMIFSIGSLDSRPARTDSADGT